MVFILNALQTTGIAITLFLLFLVTKIYNYVVLSYIFLFLSLLFFLKVGLYYQRKSQKKQKREQSLHIINQLSQAEPLHASVTEE